MVVSAYLQALLMRASTALVFRCAAVSAGVAASRRRATWRARTEARQIDEAFVVSS